MTKIVRYILRIIYPILAFWGKLHVPWTRKLITSKDLDDIIYYLNPGDILLSYTKGEFTNLSIPSMWKHVGMIDNSSRNVIEAKGIGVIKTDLREFCLKKDKLALVRPKLGRSDRNKSAGFATQQVGKPYDFSFEIPERKHINESFYCSELPHWCYSKCSDTYSFKLRKILGVDAIKPDDYWNAKDHFEIIWSSMEGKHYEA